MEPPSVKSQVHKGIKWVTLSILFVQATRLITTIVLTHLLDPRMFGLLAMAVLTIDILGTMRHLGFGAAYIQRPEKEGEPPHLAADTLFWLVLAVNGTLFAAAWLATPFIAGFFRTEELESILRLMFTVFLLEALSAVPNVDLQKRMEFKKQASCEIAHGMAYPLIGVTLAAAGAGVWSLVYAVLGSRLVFTIMIVKVGRWIPRFSFSRSVAAELFHFGKYMWGHMILTKVARALDKAVIGRFYGAVSLGFYSMAYSLCDMPSSQLSVLVNKIAFPAFSKVQDDLARLRRGFLQMLSHVSLVSIPMMVGLLAVSDQLPGTVFDTRWAPMVPYVRVLAFYGMVMSISAVTGPLFMAIGRPKVVLFVSIPQYALKIVLLIVLMRFDELGICYAVVIPWALFSVVYFVLVTRYLQLSARELLEPIVRPGLAAAMMYVVIEVLEDIIAERSAVPPWILFAGFVILGILVYAAGSMALNRRALFDVLETGRRVLKGGGSDSNTEEHGR